MTYLLNSISTIKAIITYTRVEGDFEDSSFNRHISEDHCLGFSDVR